VSYPRYFVIPKLFRSLHGVFLTVSVLKHFRAVVRDFRPDVIVAFYAYPYGFSAVQLARMFHTPVATGVLGSDINRMARSGITRLMIRWCLNSSGKVFSVSSALRDAMIEMGVRPEKIVVIPNGVDPTRFPRVTRLEARVRLGLPDSVRIVLCVANLVRVKGVDLVVRAFSQLHHESAVLLIVGDGEESNRIRRMIHELHLEGRVHLLGAKPPRKCLCGWPRPMLLYSVAAGKDIRMLLLKPWLAGDRSLPHEWGRPETLSSEKPWSPC